MPEPRREIFIQLVAALIEAVPALRVDSQGLRLARALIEHIRARCREYLIRVAVHESSNGRRLISPTRSAPELWELSVARAMMRVSSARS